MMTDTPHFRYLQVKEALDDKSKVLKLDKYGTSLYLYLKGAISATDPIYSPMKSVVDRYNNKLHRKVLTALFVSSCSHGDIAKITGLPQKVILLYEKLFFDYSVFETKIDIWSFIESTVEDEELIDFYMHAFRLGPEFIKWNMGSTDYGISHKEMAKDLMYESYMHSKSCLIRQAPVATVKQWTGITHQYIRLVEDLDMEVKNPLDDIIFRLKEDTSSKTVNDFARDEIV